RRTPGRLAPCRRRDRTALAETARRIRAALRRGTLVRRNRGRAEPAGRHRESQRTPRARGGPHSSRIARPGDATMTDQLRTALDAYRTGTQRTPSADFTAATLDRLG